MNKRLQVILPPGSAKSRSNPYSRLLLPSFSPPYTSIFSQISRRMPKRAKTLGNCCAAGLIFRLPDAIERFGDLPALILQRPNDEYINLLNEARELFTMGYFYSCVAMCGIVGERLIKDLVRGSLVISRDGLIERPSEEAFDQLERVDASAFVRFLRQTQLLGEEAKKAVEDLIFLRNQYAHARGKQPQQDALSAITKLHILVEGTVSVLKDFEIINGKLVPRTAKL